MENEEIEIVIPTGERMKFLKAEIKRRLKEAGVR